MAMYNHLLAVNLSTSQCRDFCHRTTFGQRPARRKLDEKQLPQLEAMGL